MWIFGMEMLLGPGLLFKLMLFIQAGELQDGVIWI